ncbi:hypothetical protein EIN_303570 [Entamoeba invadens IP1]|uniref:Uncharacterized protein n=1 Tax=Entamoeba invadens IP1 TaxID=370355 RepID=A0A0A1UCB9_ENTIV|nr:hypothetical protein EIN_303570 [Entamoeba invadens IP1]ELP89923.1 hypothetical protein EIN_303570 [Entamoeba invadens IP1]|eukprot:XP_004256694.1 hypothetical protein EIN_303570 [Entamoeba invadens IP1]
MSDKCAGGFCAATVLCVISVATAVICGIFTLAFPVPSYIFGNDMKDFAACDPDNTLQPYDLAYNTGYYFGLLNIIFTCVCFGIALFSIIPGVGMLNWIIALPASCGSIAFFVLGIVILVQGLGIDWKDLAADKRKCVEAQYKCCFDTTDCECTEEIEGNVVKCTKDCKKEFIDEAEYKIKVIGAMNIVGSGYMGFYTITASITTWAALAFCCGACFMKE